jgi:hypothetical protein
MMDERRLITDIMFDPAYEETIMRSSLGMNIRMEDFRWAYIRIPLGELVKRILGWFVKK